MTTAFLLFAASFAVVFALGIQQYNVTHGHRAAAFATSLAIGLASLVQLKVLPGPTTWLDVAGYLLGSACGIVASMWAHPRLLKRLAPQSPAAHAERLSEQVRLAHDIADEAARTDIEYHCGRMSMGNHVWYDTLLPRDTESNVPGDIARAEKYLRMRGRLLQHPVQRSLVRFTQ